MVAGLGVHREVVESRHVPWHFVSREMHAQPFHDRLEHTEAVELAVGAVSHEDDTPVGRRRQVYSHCEASHFTTQNAL